MADFSLNADLKEHYDGYYSGGQGAQWRRLGALGKAANIVRLCRKYPHAQILEIGAGEGAILQRLDELNFGERYSALEISDSGIEAIEKRSISRLDECKQFDGYSIPHADQSFDLAILTHVVEHVEHPRQLLEEAARVAKYVFVEVPLEDTIRLDRDYVADSLGHINFFSPVTIRRLLQTCGFKVVKQSVTNPSRAVQEFRKGKKGTLNYFIKQTGLKVAPAIAPRIWVYHGSILCRSPHFIADESEKS